MRKAIDNAVEFAWRVHYKTKYDRYLKEVIKEPIHDCPPEVGKKAVDAVWGRYCRVDPRWAQYYYMMNGIASPNYVSSEVWFGKICRTLNQRKKYPYPMLQDKNYLDLVFSDLVEKPGVIVRNINGQFLDRNYLPISANDAVRLCLQNDEIVIKPSVESKGGRAIEFISPSSTTDSFSDSVEKTLHDRKKDFIVQRVVKQHKTMARLNSDSINTVRVLTLLWNGEVIVLSVLVRIGVKGIRVDNPHTSNGVSCVLDHEGKMIKHAYDRDWHPHTQLPNGIVFEGYQIPNYADIIETVKKLHYRVPHARIIGWDMTVSENGTPVLIEANLDTPEIYFHQIGTGPIFDGCGLLDEIMTYVTK